MQDISLDPSPVIVRAEFADYQIYRDGYRPKGGYNFGFCIGMNLDAPERIPAGSCVALGNIPILTTTQREQA